MSYYGKTTTGDILLDGVSTANMRREDVHNQFCMVLQDTWLFEGTIRENLVYNAEGIPDSRLDAVCKAVGLYHFIQTLSNGYDTVLNDHMALLAQGGFYAELYNSQFEQAS